MPNWAMNRLYVSGNAVFIQNFYNSCLVNGKFCFSGIVPEPEYKHPDEFLLWRYDNWGTKWDIDGDIDLVEETAGSRTFVFNTAWAGPYEWLKAVAKKFPELTFRMYSTDPSMDWHTECMGRSGKLYILRDTYENNEKFWENNNAFFRL